MEVVNTAAKLVAEACQIIHSYYNGSPEKHTIDKEIQEALNMLEKALEVLTK